MADTVDLVQGVKLDLVRFRCVDLVQQVWPGGACMADTVDLVQGVEVDLVRFRRVKLDLVQFRRVGLDLVQRGG